MSQPLTTQVAQHRGVLAGAVHGDDGLLAGPDHRDLRDVVERVVRRGLQCRLVQAGQRQDPAHALEVERLAGVRGAGQRQQVRRQVQTEPTMPSAWSGLLHERGSTGAVTSPTDQSAVPSAASATTDP